jgi:hypothetical protein
MAFLGYTILATEGFLHEVSVINYRVKTFISKPCIQVIVKEGVGGKRYDFFKGDFELMEIVHEEEASSDTGQRIKNAAIGTVLLGPIGLLGAAFGGKKSILKVRFVTKDSKKFLLELKPGDCQKIFKELMDVDLEKEINKKLL